MSVAGAVGLRTCGRWTKAEGLLSCWRGAPIGPLPKQPKRYHNTAPMTEPDIILKHRPLTGQGQRLRESESNPGNWLVKFNTGDLRWVHESEFMVSGDGGSDG